MYWVDISGNTIDGANMDSGSDHQVVLDTGMYSNPNDLAIDFKGTFRIRFANKQL